MQHDVRIRILESPRDGTVVGQLDRADRVPFNAALERAAPGDDLMGPILQAGDQVSTELAARARHDNPHDRQLPFLGSPISKT